MPTVWYNTTMKGNFQKDKVPFTQVANEVLSDSSLSLKAKGM